MFSYIAVLKQKSHPELQRNAHGLTEQKLCYYCLIAVTYS